MVKYTDLSPNINGLFTLIILIALAITIIAFFIKFIRIFYVSASIFLILTIGLVFSSSLQSITKNIPKDSVLFGQGIDTVDGPASTTGYIEAKDLNKYLKDKYHIVRTSDDSYENIKTNKKYDNCTINYGDTVKIKGESFKKIKKIECLSKDIL